LKITFKSQTTARDALLFVRRSLVLSFQFEYFVSKSLNESHFRIGTSPFPAIEILWHVQQMKKMGLFSSSVINKSTCVLQLAQCDMVEV